MVVVNATMLNKNWVKQFFFKSSSRVEGDVAVWSLCYFTVVLTLDLIMLFDTVRALLLQAKDQFLTFLEL